MEWIWLQYDGMLHENEKSETNKQQCNLQNKNSNLADELSKNNVQPNIYIYLAQFGHANIIHK